MFLWTNLLPGWWWAGEVRKYHMREMRFEPQAKLNSWMSPAGEESYCLWIQLWTRVLSVCFIHTVAFIGSSSVKCQWCFYRKRGTSEIVYILMLTKWIRQGPGTHSAFSRMQFRYWPVLGTKYLEMYSKWFPADEFQTLYTWELKSGLCGDLHSVRFHWEQLCEVVCCSLSPTIWVNILHLNVVHHLVYQCVCDERLSGMLSGKLP